MKNSFVELVWVSGCKSRLEINNSSILDSSFDLNSCERKKSRKQYRVIDR